MVKISQVKDRHPVWANGSPSPPGPWNAMLRDANSDFGMVKFLEKNRKSHNNFSNIELGGRGGSAIGQALLLWIARLSGAPGGIASSCEFFSINCLVRDPSARFASLLCAIYQNFIA